jgi:TonB-linked SusC/RagA family outer membrane protein
MEKKYLILSIILSSILAFACALPVQAQQSRKVTGIIVGEDEKPIIGATVKVSGTNAGTITDVDGRFTLSVPVNGKLDVSYLGYISQTVSNLKDPRIVLKEDVMKLDEVVVVGYGTQKKAHLTGSVASVATSDISDLSVTSLSSALGGQINGVSVNESGNRPGDAASIVIRNSNLTVSSPSSSSGLLVPLYVIDGFVYTPEAGQSAFNNLDPSMIESMSVLKDAAAAIYGARSAQGVVLVKTKRGQVGKPKISYSGQFGYTDEFYRSKMMDSYNFGTIWNGIRAADPTSPYDKKNDLFQADELNAMKSLNYDLLDKYWSFGMTQKHSVNISGGTDNATYFAGMSYVTQDGNLGKIDYSRWNYNAGVDTKINKWTKASLKVSGDYGNTTKANVKVGGSNADKDYVTLLTRPRYIPESVNGLPIAAYGVTNGRVEQSQEYNYNVVENLGNFVKNMPQNMVINASLEYDFGWSNILRGLKLQGTYSKSISTTKDNEYGSDYSLYKFSDGARGGSGSHLYTDTEGYAMNFNGMTTVPVSNGNYLKRNTSRTDSYQLNFIATYARKIGKHDISALFTIEKAENESEYVWGNVTGPYTFTNYQSNGAGGNQTTAFSRSEGGVLSYVGRLNYAYSNKYLAEFLIRSDASTKFAPENYWGVFPSLSVGWIVSEESWFKKYVPFIDFLKIRGSYGLLGRDNVAAWAWAQFYGSETVKGPIFGTDPNLNAGAHFQIPSAVPNRNSHWDKSYKSNLGLDLAFLNNRLSVTLDGYYDKNREVFMAITDAPNYPSTVGAVASASNYGSIDNYGIEVSLGWRDKIGKDFKYTVKLSTGYSDNKILKAPWKDLASRELDDIVPNERADRGLWGYQSIGMFRSYQEIAEYFAENKIVTYMGKTQADVHPGMLIYNNIRGSRKADGTYYAINDPADPTGNVIDKNDRVQISKFRSNPYGFTLNLAGEWKSLSFSAQLGANWGSYTMMPNQAITNSSIISTASGYDVMQYTNLPSFWAGNMFVYQDVLDNQGKVVSSKNLDAKYPNLRFSDVNGVASTFWKVSNTNISLRNITLAYSLPKGWVKKVGVESCRLNVTGQNMLSFYNPYPDHFMSPMSSYSTYPTLRKITMGINVSF